MSGTGQHNTLLIPDTLDDLFHPSNSHIHGIDFLGLDVQLPAGGAYAGTNIVLQPKKQREKKRKNKRSTKRRGVDSCIKLAEEPLGRAGLGVSLLACVS